MIEQEERLLRCAQSVVHIEGASPFVRKCGSATGARRGGGAKERESVDARRIYGLIYRLYI